jgi:hypothetical protein
MKTKNAVIVGAFVVLVVGTIVLVEWHQRASSQRKSQPAKVPAVMQQVRQANVLLPERQTQAKMLMMAAFVQKKIPAAANWCETLNAGGGIWPATPTNTAFAINTNVAGRALSRTLPGDTVVFFETANAGWNQAGGSELLAASPDGIAVAFADGRALIVSPAEAANLRWAP